MKGEQIMDIKKRKNKNLRYTKQKQKNHGKEKNLSV
jgi:hypothetical protein